MSNTSNDPDDIHDGTLTLSFLGVTFCGWTAASATMNNYEDDADCIPEPGPPRFMLFSALVRDMRFIASPYSSLWAFSKETESEQSQQPTFTMLSQCDIEVESRHYRAPCQRKALPTATS